jgi:hypothetical protein
MMVLGLSGTTELGRSGTASSDYREPKSAAKPQKSGDPGPLNYANKESFGFLLTSAACGQENREPPGRGGTAEVAAARRDHFTEVELFWQEGVREHWLRFGKPVASRIRDRKRRVECYAPGQTFGFVRWASNDYGTVLSRFDVLLAVGRGEPVTRFPHVTPGADVLLSVSGWRKVRRVFGLIDAIEALGIDPCDAAPDHWRHIHNRLIAAEAPRPYSPERHSAWLARKALQS